MPRVPRPRSPGQDVRLETQPTASARRLMRTPSFPFRLVTRPWQIVPCLIAPVLVGDTLRRYSLQMRVLSDPVSDRLVGWWHEFFLFYMKISDFPVDEQGGIKDMLISRQPLSPWGTDQPAFYQTAGAYGWIIHAYERCVDSYFRNEGGGLAFDYQIGAYAAAKAHSSAWWDSLVFNDDLDEPVAGDPEEYDQKWEAYRQMRSSGLTTATYAEYLAMGGTATPPQLEEADARFRRPEVLRFVRDFQYPVQSVEPSTGVPSALLQWTIADKMMRGRTFAEPGVLIGLVCTRPKVYLKNQRGNMTSYLMSKAEAWLPTALDTDPHTVMQMFAGGSDGPLFGATEDYWIDPRDFLQRGDQFVNFDLSVPITGRSIVDLPQVGVPSDSVPINPEFPSGTDADNLFSGANKTVNIDGICSFSIAGRAGGTDRTARTRW